MLIALFAMFSMLNSYILIKKIKIDSTYNYGWLFLQYWISSSLFFQTDVDLQMTQYGIWNGPVFLWTPHTFSPVLMEELTMFQVRWQTCTSFIHYKYFSISCNHTGNTSRFCSGTGNWGPTDVTQCESYKYRYLAQQVPKHHVYWALHKYISLHKLI